MRFVSKRSLWLGLAGLMSMMCMTSCGPDTNWTKIWADDDGVDSLLVRARAAYDRGSFSDAASLAEKALKEDGQNEGGAIILGYISLAQGEMDSFSLLKKLIDLGGGGSNLTAVPEKLTGHWEVDLDLMSDAIAKDAATPQPENTQAAKTTERGQKLLTATSSLTSTMDTLKDLVDLTDSDKSTLSTAYGDQTVYGRTFYADYPLVNPQAVIEVEIPLEIWPVLELIAANA